MKAKPCIMSGCRNWIYISSMFDLCPECLKRFKSEKYKKKLEEHQRRGYGRY